MMARHKWAILGVTAFVTLSALLAFKAYTSLDQPDTRVETWVLQDFREIIYYPSVAILDGVNPYDTSVYPERYPIRWGFPLYAPHSLILNLPFTLLPPGTAEVVYFCFSLVMVVVLAWLALRVCDAPTTVAPVMIVASLILLTRALYGNILNGQPTLQIVIGSVLALEYARTRPWLAAAGLALAAVKPTYGVPLAILMLCHGRVRPVALGVFIAAVPAAIVCVVLVQISGGVSELVDVLAANPGYFQINANAIARTSWHRLDLVASLAKILKWDPPQTFSIVATLGLLLAIGVILARRTRKTLSETADGLAYTMIYLAILVAIYHNPYDVLLLVPPLVSLALGTDQRWAGVNGNSRWVLFMLMAVPAFNYAATYRVMMRMETDGALWTAAASSSGMALLAALALCAVLSLRQHGQPVARPD